jgi:hypothetical protein
VEAEADATLKVADDARVVVVPVGKAGLAWQASQVVAQIAIEKPAYRCIGAR